ncbi:hypothetical protein [Nonomuraea basaltis]|nr:hypothetical protein [Nonomuraea basaltis]
MVHTFFKNDRATMTSLASRLEFQVTSADQIVLDALHGEVRTRA